jgi:hypothetical protein
MVKQTNSNGFSALVLLLLIVILGAVGFIGYTVFRSQNKSTSGNMPALSSSPEFSGVDSHNVINNVAEKLKADKLVKTAVGASDDPALAGIKVTSDNYVNWRPSNGNFSVNAPDSLGATIDFSGVSDISGLYGKVYKSIEATMTEEGLKKSSDANFTNQVYVGYSTAAVSCQLYAYDENTNPLTVACGDIAALKKVHEAAKPFAAAYYKTYPDPDKRLALTSPKISDSQTAGYQMATSNVSTVGDFGGAAAKFYKAPGGDWKLLQTTQMQLSCDDYNTPDARAAYKGQPCAVTDSNAQSTVQ